MWFGWKTWLLQWGTVARPVNLAQASPVNLAQASQSRLGEMKQGASLGPLHEKSPRRLAQLLSEQATRPGERDLAYARSRVAHATTFVLSPRRGGGSPERARLA